MVTGNSSWTQTKVRTGTFSEWNSFSHLLCQEWLYLTSEPWLCELWVCQFVWVFPLWALGWCSLSFQRRKELGVEQHCPLLARNTNFYWTSFPVVMGGWSLVKVWGFLFCFWRKKDVKPRGFKLSMHGDIWWFPKQDCSKHLNSSLIS